MKVDLSTVLKTLEDHKEEIRGLGVKKLGVFGSIARNQGTDQSDIDFLVEFDKKSFDSYMDLKLLLEDIFKRKVDLVLSNVIKPQLKAPILKDVKYASGF